MSKKKPQVPRDAARSSEPKPGEDVVALINERKQIDDWIAALDAKRDQTPPKVFTRVRGDYEARLKGVADKLASHHSSLGAELAALKKKLDRIDDEIEEQQEERAEIELRSNVGELDTSEVGGAFREVDAELARLAAARASIEADLARVNEFFAAAAGGPPPAGAADASRRSAGGFDELSFLHSVVGDQASTATPAQKLKVVEPQRENAIAAPPPTPKAEPAPAPEPRSVSVGQTASAPAVVPAAASPSTPPAPESTATAAPPHPVAEPAKPVVERVELPPRRTGEAGVTPAEAKAVEAKPAEAKPAAKESAKPAELTVEKESEPLVAPPKREARLSIAMQQASMTIEPEDVAPRSSIGIVKANEGPSQLLEGIAPATAADEKPFAANVASNNPLSLKSTAKGDIKTLKCRECGAMNDPTEWYCERCGAELSGL